MLASGAMTPMGAVSARGCAAVQPPLRRRCCLQATPQRRLSVVAASAAQPPAAQPAPVGQRLEQQPQPQRPQQPQQLQSAAPPPQPQPTLLQRLLRPGVLAAAGLAAACALAAASPPAALAAKASAAAEAASGGGLAALAKSAVSFVLHLDVHLGEIVARYGATTYAILFAIVFAETGLVVTPFLPGDSLLFATGALAALGKLTLGPLLACYVVAATLGDAVNYAIGNALGAAALSSKLIKREHLAKTEQFYEKYGGKTVVLARFVPIVRTLAPFVAGVGSMPYRQFGLYNVVGALLWTGVCVGAGYAFGNVPAVHENFSLVVLGIVAVSLLPIAWELYAAKREAAAEAAAAAGKGAKGGGGAVPHSTPPSAAAAVETAGLPPRVFPAAVAAAEEAIDLARSKMADPLEDARQQQCEKDPDNPECRVWD